jgi:outer membrane protein OmpA-like peptidoglycan-associated protein
VAIAAPEGLLAAIDAYMASIVDLQAAIDAGSGIPEAEARMNAARDELASLCSAIGLSDLAACMAAFGFELPAVPEIPIAKEPIPEEQPVADDQPVVTEEAADEEPAVEEQPAPEEEAPTEPVEEAENEADPEDVAPLLDSQKDAETEVQTETEAEATAESGGSEQPAAEADQPADDRDEWQPAPASDEEAQAEATPAEVESVEAEQGTRVEETQAAPQISIFGDLLEALDGRLIIRFEDDRVFVENDDSDRLSRDAEERYLEELRDGRTRETIIRPNGTRIVTIRNRYGDIVRRSRITPDGREVILVYVTEDGDPRDRDGDGDPDPYWYDPGRDLPPLVLGIPVGDYVLDADDASEDRVADFLDEPPVEGIQRFYSIDEVKRSARIRDMVRRLEIGGLTFEFGKASIAPDQIDELSNVAGAMLGLLDRNPAETFLIEGHTDAVGSEVANLALSDRRAETVAIVLSEVFGIPPENLATQGYGERYLKIRTEEPERINRRVTIRRITPLVTPIAISQ